MNTEFYTYLFKVDYTAKRFDWMAPEKFYTVVRSDDEHGAKVMACRSCRITPFEIEKITKLENSEKLETSW